MKSLEDVVIYYLDFAEKKAEEAREQSQGMAEDIDDLDQAASPERFALRRHPTDPTRVNFNCFIFICARSFLFIFSLLLSAVTGADAHDRADRTVLSPWLRFLWESYRQCLELLRNNVQARLRV